LRYSPETKEENYKNLSEQPMKRSELGISQILGISQTLVSLTHKLGCCRYTNLHASEGVSDGKAPLDSPPASRN
jgi:hypothetical protein